MNSIEIFINSIGNKLDILIDTKNNKIMINNKEKNITKEKIDDLLRIIRTWEPIYKKKTNLIDSEKFLIKINTNEGIDIIKGEGNFPENYITFKKWLGEFYD